MRRIWFAAAFLTTMATPANAENPSFSLPLDCTTAPAIVIGEKCADMMRVA